MLRTKRAVGAQLCMADVQWVAQMADKDRRDKDRHSRTGPRARTLAIAATLAVTTGSLAYLLLWRSKSSSPCTLHQRHTATAQLLPPPAHYASATHLIMVAGHAVYVASSRTAADVVKEESWFLESFQHGQLSTMLAHIRRGVELAAADNRSLLIFSGGETRAAAGPRSEALSYWEAAEALGWYGTPYVRERSVLEPHARDSLENLLFALCRFYEVAGRYPERVTVVSFGFKRRRFVELHRAALRLPRSRFAYVGIDPHGLGLDVLKGEISHSSKPFERDPYGCAEAELQRKRAARDPFRRGARYADGCPALTALLEHCEPSAFRGPLPWSAHVGDDEDTDGSFGSRRRQLAPSGQADVVVVRTARDYHTLSEGDRSHT